jgi:hypothetical protein
MYHRPSHCQLGLFIVILLPSDRLGFSYTDVMYTGVDDWGVKATIIDDVNSVLPSSIIQQYSIHDPPHSLLHIQCQSASGNWPSSTTKSITLWS